MRAALKAGLVTALAGGLVAASLLPQAPDTVDARADDDGKESYFELDTYKPSPNDNAVLQWNEEALECVRVSPPRPTVTARALYLLHTAVYDAWSVYDGTAAPTVRYSGWTRAARAQRTAGNKVTAISHAAHVVLSSVYPRCSTAFSTQVTALGQRLDDSGAAAAAGRRAGEEVLKRALADGSNQVNNYADTSGYKPVNSVDQNVDPWRWQPLRIPTTPTPTTQSPLTPHWGNVTPFVAGVAKEAAQADDPRKLSDKEKRQLLDEVVAYSAALDDRSKAIAEYWADGPSTELPPGHWNVFAQWLSRRHGQSLDADAKMFFGLNGALHDAAIASWTLKYRYDFARPITAVRNVLRGQTIRAWAGPGQGTQLVQGENWMPYQPSDFVSPAFPAYTSGHSTFSAAAAAFLKDFGSLQGRDGAAFGATVTIQPGSSRVEPGITPSRPVVLRWERLEDAANEAGISRQYGGIHWSIDDYPGRDVGKKCGEAAFSRAKKYWEGG